MWGFWCLRWKNTHPPLQQSSDKTNIFTVSSTRTHIIKINHPSPATVSLSLPAGLSPLQGSLLAVLRPGEAVACHPQASPPAPQISLARSAESTVRPDERRQPLSDSSATAGETARASYDALKAITLGGLDRLWGVASHLYCGPPRPPRVRACVCACVCAECPQHPVEERVSAGPPAPSLPSLFLGPPVLQTLGSLLPEE